MEKDFWFKELHTEDAGIILKGDILYKKKSKFQEILVIDNPTYGKTLILDGCVMTTEKDEAFYHEMLVHPAMLSHRDPRRVLIIGGGDGGALREVLKHEVEEAVLVELDEEVLKIARSFFPRLSSSFDDPRARVLSEEGVNFVKNSARRFDVILVDSPDPVGFAKELFSEDFYASSRKILNEGGILVAQTESPILHFDLVKEVQRSLRRVFPFVSLYLTTVPTYPGCLWSFSIASDTPLPGAPLRDPPDGLRVYSQDIHRAAFSLPPFLKNAFA